MTARNPVRTARRGGALVLVAALMIGSGLLRFGVEAGPALAKEAGKLAAAPVPSGTAPGPKPDEAPDFSGMLRAFKEREARLTARETALQDREKANALAEAAIEKQLAALVKAEAGLRATLAGAQGASESDLARLTAVYENMKPKEAAKLFEEMAPDFAAGFLARMRPEAAAGVLAGLSPATAYSISVVLAGRNTGVPKE